MSNKKEERARPGKGQGPVRHVSKAIQEFKDNLPRSVVPVVLTVIGTIAFQSGNYVVHFLLERGQLSQQIHYERQKDLALMKNKEMVMKVVAGYNPSTALEVVVEFEKSILTMNAEKREGFAKRLRSAFEEGEAHLGTLEGYNGMESTLPEGWLASHIAVSSAELQALDTALGCAENPHLTRSDRYACLNSIERNAIQAERALARTHSADEVAGSHASLFDADRTLRWDRASHEMNVLFLKLFGSLSGLAFSLYAYEKLFEHFLESEKHKAS